MQISDMAGKFTKNKEDFSCEKCGFDVAGNGFTNHCPKCLYGKHVDINPGDRAEKCCGLMVPTSIEGTQKEYVLVHKCVSCGAEKKNKISMDDSFDAITAVAKNAAKKASQE